MLKLQWMAPLAGLMIMGCAGSAGLGASGQDLAPCPDSPNCVSSRAKDAKHFLAPIPYEGSGEEAMNTLAAVVQAMPRARIAAQEGNYLHAVFTSRILRFKDDVEFQVDGQAKLIHFRSASRVGYSDLGANRSRMEEITARFQSSK